MACMCGDTHCWSCGPAQGNWRCPICNAWADDCCEHMNEDSSDIKPEFAALAEEQQRREREDEERFAVEMEEADRRWAERQEQEAMREVREQDKKWACRECSTEFIPEDNWAVACPHCLGSDVYNVVEDLIRRAERD